MISQNVDNVNDVKTDNFRRTSNNFAFIIRFVMAVVLKDPRKQTHHTDYKNNSYGQKKPHLVHNK